MSVIRRGELWLGAPTTALLLLTGCASQGPLRPPSLNLPAAVRRLDAERTGGTVNLRWLNPSKTSDGVSLLARHGAGPLTAQVCRGEATVTDRCTPFTTMPVSSGSTTDYTDRLPAALASGAVRRLFYGVRVVNAKGKGAGWIGVTTAAGAAPAPVQGLEGHPVANGILLRWRPGDGGVMLRVSRGQDASKSTLLQVTPLETTGSGSLDGAVDTGGRVGQEQRYIAFRQRAVTLDGETISMQSEPVTAVVPATARLPLPAPPTGLDAVANTLGSPEIDLVWQPPDDPSITGYRVYRQQDDAPSVPLTAVVVRGFTFADTTVTPGHRYTYRVSSVNPTGESSASVASVALP